MVAEYFDSVLIHKLHCWRHASCGPPFDRAGIPQLGIVQIHTEIFKTPEVCNEGLAFLSSDRFSGGHSIAPLNLGKQSFDLSLKVRYVLSEVDVFRL